jgi:purine-nucleoside phosphorylase
MNRELREAFVRTYAEFRISPPDLHVVLGSGFSQALEGLLEARLLGKKKFQEIPGLAEATVPGHRGEYHYYELSGKIVCFQLGRLHGYEGIPASQAVRTVLGPFFSGCRNFCLTNAAGSLTPNFKVGSAMVIEDQVNMTGTSPLFGPNPVGPDGEPYGPRFVDLSEAYDRHLRETLARALKTQGLSVHQGVYLGLLGPVFETPAEVRLFGEWGCGAVGMSTVWETIALKHAGARVVGVSLISNLGTGLAPGPIEHEKVLEEASRAAPKIVRGVLGLLDHL